MSNDEESNSQFLEAKPSSQFIQPPPKEEASPAEISKLISFTRTSWLTSTPGIIAKSKKEDLQHNYQIIAVVVSGFLFCSAISYLMTPPYSRLYLLPLLPPY
jgi:hypothetical protein